MYLKQENNTYRREEEPMKKDGAVGMQINCVSNLIRRSIDLRIAGMPGEKLSRMDSWIIHYMLDHQQEDVFQKDVEKALAMTRSNVSKAVDQMVSKGLIMRSPVDYDARLKKLTLTPKGRYLVVVMMRQFFIGVNNLRDQARAALPGEEKELLFGC